MILWTLLAVLLALTWPIWFSLFAMLSTMLMGGLFWLVGAKVTIKKGGTQIGYVRWFKFHRTKI